MISIGRPNLVDILIVARDAREDEKQQYKILTGRDWDSDYVATEGFNKAGVKFVFLDDNKPFCVGGWEPVVDGVWQSWMIGNMDYWESHWRTITKLCRQTMQIMFDDGARRLQTYVLESRTKTCDWYVRGLKMQPEGVFRNFGMNGEDMALYSRIRDQVRG